MELHNSSEQEAPEKVTNLFSNSPLVLKRAPHDRSCRSALAPMLRHQMSKKSKSLQKAAKASSHRLRERILALIYDASL
jgi:hypothetical protein